MSKQDIIREVPVKPRRKVAAGKFSTRHHHATVHVGIADEYWNPVGGVRVGLFDHADKIQQYKNSQIMTAPDLREVAEFFNELADVLEENGSA